MNVMAARFVDWANHPQGGGHRAPGNACGIALPAEWPVRRAPLLARVGVRRSMIHLSRRRQRAASQLFLMVFPCHLSAMNTQTAAHANSKPLPSSTPTNSGEQTFITVPYRSPAVEMKVSTRWFLRLTALFVVGVVALIYARASANGRLPPGHPYAPISFSLFALTLAGSSFAASRRVRGVRVVVTTFLVMALITSILWVLSSLRP
jgi:hypothetical protein